MTNPTLGDPSLAASDPHLGVDRAFRRRRLIAVLVALAVLAGFAFVTDAATAQLANAVGLTEDVSATVTGTGRAVRTTRRSSRTVKVIFISWEEGGSGHSGQFDTGISSRTTVGDRVSIHVLPGTNRFTRTGRLGSLVMLSIYFAVLVGLLMLGWRAVKSLRRWRRVTTSAVDAPRLPVTFTAGLIKKRTTDKTRSVQVVSDGSTNFGVSQLAPLARTDGQMLPLEGSGFVWPTATTMFRRRMSEPLLIQDGASGVFFLATGSFPSPSTVVGAPLTLNPPPTLPPTPTVRPTLPSPQLPGTSAPRSTSIDGLEE